MTGRGETRVYVRGVEPNPSAMSDFIPILILFAILAVVIQQGFTLTLIYLLVGVYLAVRWWSRRAMQAVGFGRAFSARHAFIGETITVKLEAVNRGWLPVVWMRLHESLPARLATPPFVDRVISLGPREREQIEYTLHASRRGYYPAGPLFIYSGDIFGFKSEAQQSAAEYVTVYPKIVPLPGLWLPSRSPIGALRHALPIYEDPNRVIGKRDYVDGDSLRRVDWKTTAAVGRLQVRQYEPSINLETVVMLNLNEAEYELATRPDATELAIVVAASIAARVAGQRQAVGLMTNGADPLIVERPVHVLPPRKGRAHLRRILELLARVEAAETCSLFDMLRGASVHLAWGATLVLVTRQTDVSLLEGLIQTGRAGFNPMLVLCGLPTVSDEAERRTRHLGIPVYRISRERDLDIWRN
jgi:uncharacterized protein (DUF58 family)